MNPGQLVLVGFLLGWSVAWPPGPINAEMLRRAVARGFWPAYALGLGACAGDAAWAAAVALGASALAAWPPAMTALWYVSHSLLLFLAVHYLAGAWRHVADWRAGRTPAPAKGLDSSRAAFLLGFTLALTSPWNLGFWIGVMGMPELAGHGLAAALIIAAAVVAGAAIWCTVLCGLAAPLAQRLTHPLWEAGTRAVTAAVLLAFAAL